MTMNKRVLVTGGAGFIGSFLVDALIVRGYQVRILDNLDPQVHPDGKPPNYLNEEAEFIHDDVCNYEGLKRTIKDVKIIFHEASAVGVGQSQYQVKKYVDVNVGGTANLLDILVNFKHKVEKIIVAASMSSYGEGRGHCPTCGIGKPSFRPSQQMALGDWEVHCPKCNNHLSPISTDENTRRQCNSIYALTKKQQEDMVLNIGKTYSIPSVSLRYFNVYGPRQSLSNPYTGVAAIFISRLKNSHQPTVYENGLQTRDFVSVYDVVNANLLAMDIDKADYQAFNIGSGIPRTIKSIAESLASVMGKDLPPVITHTYRKGDVRHCFADIRKAQKLLGFEPKVTFEDGLRELIEWSNSAPAVDKFDLATQELKEKGLV